MANFKDVYDKAVALNTKMRAIGTDTWLIPDTIQSVTLEDLDKVWELESGIPDTLWIVFRPDGDIWGVFTSESQEMPEGCIQKAFYSAVGEAKPKKAKGVKSGK